MRRYGVILADPPWQYSNNGISGAAENHYPTMSINDLCALPIRDMASNDALLLMWTTWPLLDVTMPIIQAWGFEYKTGMPWIKMQGIPTTDLFGQVVMKAYPGQGWWVRGTSEPLLICTRGNIKPPENVPTGLISERMQHSKKPSNAHEYGQLFPGPYLELFARRPREGWDVWGNEVESSIQLAKEQT
jgi:N6-adenosine-specific RNA methylase IME4